MADTDTCETTLYRLLLIIQPIIGATLYITVYGKYTITVYGKYTITVQHFKSPEVQYSQNDTICLFYDQTCTI